MDTLRCLQRAVDFMEENLCDKMSMEAIASHAYMSVFHFQRLFSAVCGVSVGEYIRGRRLTLAGEALAKQNIRVIDAALQYGYESPESFSRAFTRFHGVSPLAARGGGVLRSLPRLSVQSIAGGLTMQKWEERGYTVRENAPVYYTNDMDKTAKWFEDVLGWCAGIDARGENGEGLYGCLMPLPVEMLHMALAPFNGFHMFPGEPSAQTVAFLRVDSVENLRAFVLKNGWERVSEIKQQPWGGKECDVTTIDGGIIRFFQLD